MFTVVFGGTAVTVDLSDLPCPRLVRLLAAALASIGRDDGPVRTLDPDFRQMIRHLRAFACLAVGRLGTGDAGQGDVSPPLLEDFEAGLIGRYGTSGSQVHRFMATVIRLLKLAEQADPGVLTAPVQARLSYSTSLPSRRGRPLNADPMPVLEAIQRAALADARAIRERADAERAAGAAAPLTPAQAVPLLVGLFCLTGLEPECAKGLRSGCLSSPSSSGFVSPSHTKKRAHARASKTMRVRAGGIATPAGLIRLVARLTEPARLAAGSDALWVGAGGSGLRAWFDTGYELTSQLRAWASRHGLDQLDVTAAARCGSTCGGSANRCGPAATCRPAGSSTISRPATPRPSPPRTTPTSARTMPCMIRPSEMGCARRWRRHCRSRSPPPRSASRSACPARTAAADHGPAPGRGQRRSGRVPGVVR